MINIKILPVQLKITVSGIRKWGVKKENAVLECHRAEILAITAQVYQYHSFLQMGFTNVTAGVPGYNSVNHMKVHMTKICCPY